MVTINAHSLTEAQMSEQQEIIDALVIATGFRTPGNSEEYDQAWRLLKQRRDELHDRATEKAQLTR